MNKVYICIGVMLLAMGCKNSVEPTYKVNETVDLAPNQEYAYVLSLGIPIEGGYTIKQQASNYEISDIQIITNDSSWLQYNYKPQLNFKGVDSVVIENCISAGGTECNNIELFKFSFIIK